MITGSTQETMLAVAGPTRRSPADNATDIGHRAASAAASIHAPEPPAARVQAAGTPGLAPARQHGGPGRDEPGRRPQGLERADEAVAGEDVGA